jgi:hypothetical protein
MTRNLAIEHGTSRKSAHRQELMLHDQGRTRRQKREIWQNPREGDILYKDGEGKRNDKNRRARSLTPAAPRSVHP